MCIRDSYRDIVNQLLKAYKDLGCNMSLKIYFLYSHLDLFSENLWAVSDGHGERHHQDTASVEKRHRGKWIQVCWQITVEFSKGTFKWQNILGSLQLPPVRYIKYCLVA